MWTDSFMHRCTTCGLQWRSQAPVKDARAEQCVYCVNGPGQHTDAALDKLIALREERDRLNAKLQERLKIMESRHSEPQSLPDKAPALPSWKSLFVRRTENQPSTTEPPKKQNGMYILQREEPQLWEQFKRLVSEIDRQNQLVKDLSYQELAWKDRLKLIEADLNEQTQAMAPAKLEFRERDRKLYTIRKVDYKRGNALDNFVRRDWLEHIEEAFGRRCASCGRELGRGTVDEPTLDHYWLPKNDGGNFIMHRCRTGRLEANVILLCRSCNSEKGDRTPPQFFTADQLRDIERIESRLTGWANRDAKVERVARRWYEVKGKS